MRARRIPNGEGRLLSTKELMDYLRIGRNNAMIFGAEAGARVQIGRRVLYDRRIIDKALDEITGAGHAGENEMLQMTEMAV